VLVLSRMTAQKIVIDERITLTVVEIAGDRVRLGFDAPRSINIRREELPPREPEQDT
jgi:carbon storage regulator